MHVIASSPFDAPAEPPLNILGLSNVNQMVHEEFASYKAVSNQAPSYLNTLFNRVSSVLNKCIRSSKINIIPLRLKRHGQNCFAYSRGGGARHLTIAKRQIVSNHLMGTKMGMTDDRWAWSIQFGLLYTMKLWRYGKA